MGPLSIEKVLAEEVVVLGCEKLAHGLDQLSEGATQDSERKRKRKDADARAGNGEDRAEVQQRKAFYRSLNKLNRTALCLSGGGIRSATFCLGVIQALASFDVKTGTLRDGGQSGAPENSLLGRFRFLSTVSGGGYIGSWLSSWRHYDDFPKVWDGLTRRSDGPDVEPPEISWLRAYSNYLTPRLGVGSADSWTAVALYTRNLLLNWLVIVPALCLALLVLKLIAATSVAAARSQDDGWFILAIGLIGAAALIRAQAFATAHRPVRRAPPAAKPLRGGKSAPSPNNAGQGAFVKNDLAWSVFSAIAMTILFCSRVGTTWVESSGRDTVLTVLALVGAVLFAAGWIAGRPARRSLLDFVFWIVSGLIYGALVGVGAYLFTLRQPYVFPQVLTEDVFRRHDLTLSLPIVLGIPWVLTSQLVAEMVFVGLVSYEADSDSDREWFGRSAGFVAAIAIGWAATAFLSIAVGNIIIHEVVPHLGVSVASLGGISGVVTALIGKSSKTAATRDDEDRRQTSRILNLALAIAGPVFVAALIVGISIALDLLLIGDSLLRALNTGSPSTELVVVWILVGGAIAAVVGAIASKNVNINRFSLHAVYRNRLVRGYLGAARQARDPDRFTGFDGADNMCAHELWPPKATSGGENTYGLFHVINIALNVVDSKRLAWQERKAEPFTVSPRHCGSAYKGFRPTDQYGGDNGLTLGTAMAISGAAVSPNMGYYSSPSITLLLALFNVRLGWWLGNPGLEGESSCKTEGPSIAIKPLIEEAFGLTTDDRPYVYLSDGGHFEDLGLYEMVRRRCRFIVVVDAGEDRGFEFADLGNAVRKISIDLGIGIRFHDLHLMKNRPADSVTDELRKKIPYYATGVIDYKAADGEEAGCEDGVILYIKPALHWTESAGVVSYAAAHPTFPHETTTDQWFTESQFESYRSLGFEIAASILSNEVSLPGEPKLTLQQLLTTLPETTRPRRLETPPHDPAPTEAAS